LTLSGESRHSMAFPRVFVRRSEENQPMSAEKPTVLFLCADNSVRSQLAEALLRRHGGDRYECRSAGLSPKAVHPMVETVLRELGVETEALTPKHIGPFLGRYPVRHAIILRAPDETEAPRIFPFATSTTRWEIADPARDVASSDDRLDAVRRARDDIEHRVIAWLAEVDASNLSTSAA
jgi:arsenate reductase